MNLVSEAPILLVGLLSLLLMAGAVEDAVRMRISNCISLAILVLWIPAFLLAGPTMAVWENALVFGALLAAGTLLFATGSFGGGDVKFLSTVALWFDFDGAIWLLAYVFIAGGVLAAVIIFIRFFVADRPHIAMLKRGSGIPYGVAIGIGALITVATLRLS